MMASISAQRILGFVQQTFSGRLTPGKPLEPSTPLVSSQIIDSMGMIELLVFLERECGVTLNMTMDELKALDTAANLASYVERLRTASQPS